MFLSFLCLNFSNCFPVKTLVFERYFLFCTFVCNHWDLKLRLHLVAVPASVTLSWLAKTTKKLNTSGVDSLVLVLQKSNNFNLNAFFNFPSVCFCLVTSSLFNSCIYRPCVSLGFSEGSRIMFLSFLCLNFSNCFPVKTLVFERYFLFCTSVCNHWDLKFRLHLVAVPASVTLSWLAKTTKKLNTSGVDSLVLVLQKSNNFNLNAFFNFPSVYFCLVTSSLFNSCVYGPCVPVGLFKRSRIMFLFFFSCEIFKLFSL